MRNFRTEGIVIKRRDYGEADRILTVMTHDYGKLKIKATGVRKITSRRGAHIELLNHTILHLYRGNTFAVLTEAKMLDDFSTIKEDFNKIGLAYHLCELIDGLCPENQENRNVFELLQKTLNNLSTQKNVSLPQYAYAAEEIDDYTLGTFGVSDPSEASRQRRASLSAGFALGDASRVQNHPGDMLQEFEFSLLSELGYWNRENGFTKNFDTRGMIEDILERKLKSRSIFAKL